ncbi:MAG: hypothetical protein EXR07_13065 [Acetobacteraceae bacterium]|nr:hypothetical protein [Acetobacteraceae bacterium]
MAPASPVKPRTDGPDNIRSIGMLGPPPPYRPIIQGSAVFERGPAPDLEPWRLESLTRVPTPRGARPALDPEVPDGPYQADWSIHRDTIPATGQDQEFPAEQAPPGVPVPWPYDDEPPPGPKLPAPRAFSFRFTRTRAQSMSGGMGRRRFITRRLALWSIIAAVVVMFGAALGFGRQDVMRRFPATAPLYAALGLAGAPTAARPPRLSDSPPCADGRQPDNSRQTAGQPMNCPDTRPSTPAK